MTYKHLLYCPFTGLGLFNGYRGGRWLSNRIQVFQRFVLPSLLHQSNRNFAFWASFREEERDNPLVEKLERTLQSMRDFPFVFTYEGLCFEDDKYDRPLSLERLQDSLARTMPILKPLVSGKDHVFMTIQPSDDLYASDVVETIQSKARELTNENPYRPLSVGYRSGYMLNMATLEVAEYANDKDWTTDETSTYQTNTIPPFFTVVFPTPVFLDPEAHMKHTGPYRSHEFIADHTEYHALSGRGFMVGTHGENISTTWTHRYRGRLLSEQERHDVLLRFGLFGVEPLVLQKDSERSKRQWMLEYLPLSLQRRWIRRKSNGIGSAINDYSRFSL